MTPSRKSKVLITGCAGMLGSALARRMRDSWRVAGLYHDVEPATDMDETHRADITDEFLVRKTVARSRPDVIVHCAGLVNVDGAEDDFTNTREVNALGTRNLVRHAPDETKFVYISTDAVFDGERGGYTETDLPGPLNAYAKTKLEGEWFVTQEAPDHIVARTNFFGRHANGKSSFAEWIVSSLEKGSNIRMVTDWFFSPMFVEDLADALVTLMEGEVRGLYHVAGGERCSKHEFGVELARVFGFDSGLIQPVHFDQMVFKARRPRDMSLDCGKAAQALGAPLPSYREGLRRLKDLWP